MAVPTTQARQVVRLDARLLEGEASSWIGRVCELLDQQLGACEGLDKLSAAQSNAVRTGNSDVLMRVLSERQVLIDRVGVINAELEPFRAGKERALRRLSDAQRREVMSRIDRIAALVDGVCARDEADRVVLERERTRVGDELAGLAKSRGAVRAYGGSQPGGVAGGGARFQDRQG